MRRLGEDEVLGDEDVHAEEHAIELPLLALLRANRRPARILPVLCSSISQLKDPARATLAFLDALGRELRGRNVCYVAGADLAHAGPMYGDARPLDPVERTELAALDRRTLAALEEGDPEAFFREAVRQDDRRRLCGVAPIYAAMKASGLGAKVLGYAQWTDGQDLVSFASAVG